MNLDRFKDYDSDVRDLVLSFESRKNGHGFFDVEQLEIIADYYLEVQDVEGLDAAVSCGEALFPMSDEIRLRRAHYWSITGEYKRAFNLLHDLDRKSPNNSDVCYALGALYSMTDRPRKAISQYLKAASDGYQVGLIYGNIADEYYRIGELEKAVEYYCKSVEASPDDERSLFNLACVWAEMGQNEQAVDYFNRLVMEDPYSRWGWYCLGCVYSWLSLFEKSVDAFEYAVAIDKTFYKAYIALSDSYNYLGDEGRAVQALHDALPYTDDRAYVLYCISRLFRHSKNYHSAISYLHEALKESPSYGLAWSDLGLCCERLGLNDEAVDYYRRAVHLDPDLDLHWERLADLYFFSGRYDECCALLENGRTDASDPYLFLYRLVRCYLFMGLHNRMIQNLRVLVRQYPDRIRELILLCPQLTDDLEAMDIIGRSEN